jgi:hypothetical protein
MWSLPNVFARYFKYFKRYSKGCVTLGASKSRNLTSFQVVGSKFLTCSFFFTILTVFENYFLPTHSSPSRLTVFGSPSVKNAGTSYFFPFRDMNVTPFQYQRTPSSFSLIHQPVGSVRSCSQVCASSRSISSGGGEKPSSIVLNI